MDLREWTASILMATGTGKMATISTKRARQRAKKMAADGGSHQKALDGIARAEGHAHWGAKLATGRAIPAAVPPFDFFDREWMEKQDEDASDIREFLIRVVAASVASVDARAAVAIARLLVGAWFDGSDVVSGGFLAFIEDRIGAARIRDDEMAQDARMAGSLHQSSWRGSLVDILLGMCSPSHANDDAARVMRGAYPAGFDMAIEHARKAMRGIVRNPITALGSSGAAGLGDEVIVRLALEIWQQSPPSWNALAVADRILTAVEPHGRHQAAAEARMTVGSDFGRIWDVVGVRMDAERGSRIVGMLMGSTKASEHVLLWRYRESLEAMRHLMPGMVMAAWLEDSILKLSEGRMPFSFNPLKGTDRDGARLATLALILLQARDRLHGPSDPEPRVREAAIDLVEDVVRVITEVPAIGEFEQGLTVSYPSVLSVLEHCAREPGQFELFAALNNVDGALLERLRQGLGDPAIRMLAMAALSIFGNAALSKAAGGIDRA